MRKLFTAIFLLVAFGAPAFSQTLVARGTLGDTSTTATSDVIDIRGTGAYYHRLIFYTAGTVSTCQVKLEKAATRSGSFSDLISNQTCTSTGRMTTSITGDANFIRINLGTKTGSGTVEVVYQGFLTNPDIAGSTVAVDQSTPGTTNGVYVTNLSTDVAHDAADSGNPVKIGCRAIAFGSNPTEVAVNDRSDCYMTRGGEMFVISGHPNTITRTCRWANGTTPSNTACITVSTGTKIVVTRLTATCSGSNSGPINIKVGFATATLASDSSTGAAGLIHTFDDVAAGLGFSVGNGGGIIAIGADDEDLRYTSEDPSVACAISVSYFTTPS